jgi:hypothetical protein
MSASGRTGTVAIDRSGGVGRIAGHRAARDAATGPLPSARCRRFANDSPPDNPFAARMFRSPNPERVTDLAGCGGRRAEDQRIA